MLYFFNYCFYVYVFPYIIWKVNFTNKKFSPLKKKCYFIKTIRIIKLTLFFFYIGFQEVWWHIQLYKPYRTSCIGFIFFSFLKKIFLMYLYFLLCNLVLWIFYYLIVVFYFNSSKILRELINPNSIKQNNKASHKNKIGK